MVVKNGARVRRFGVSDARVGTVVEQGEGSNYGRVRVLWDGDPGAISNYDRPKRTWIKHDALVEVNEAPLFDGEQKINDFINWLSANIDKVADLRGVSKHDVYDAIDMLAKLTPDLDGDGE